MSKMSELDALSRGLIDSVNGIVNDMMGDYDRRLSHYITAIVEIEMALDRSHILIRKDRIISILDRLSDNLKESNKDG